MGELVQKRFRLLATRYTALSNMLVGYVTVPSVAGGCWSGTGCSDGATLITVHHATVNDPWANLYGPATMRETPPIFESTLPSLLDGSAGPQVPLHLS